MEKKQSLSDLEELIYGLELEFQLIPPERKAKLKSMGKAILGQLNEFGLARIIVICTHNSRRSQLGQLWLKVAAVNYGIENVLCYSGGTEATAFNYRMVAAISRAGFDVREIEKGSNPKYYIPLSPMDDSLDIYYSKKYDESYNPQKDFIAILVCDDAAEACPFVSGADKRIELPYTDPKAFDDTPEEALRYDEKLREIGREMLYCLATLEKSL